MTIYDRSTVELLREFVAKHPDERTFSRDQIVNWFRQHYPRLKESTIVAHLARCSTNVPVRVHYNVRPKVDDLFFRLNPREFRRYDAATDPPPIYEGVSPTPETAAAARLSEVEETLELPAQTESGNIFAYESHLRDYLANNLHAIEPGLRLFEEEGIRGVEYPIRSRRIDLLCTARDGSLVVVELKVSRGHDRTVGQILTYLGWVRQDLAEGHPVRGVIVAREISDELKTAVQESRADVKLFEYELSFKLHAVKSP